MVSLPLGLLPLISLLLRMLKRARLSPLLVTLAFATACAQGDKKQVAASAYPVAVVAQNVGTYPALAKSGAGYFYDDVLEYRVWISPPEGGDDYYTAFATFEEALSFSRRTEGAEEPLVLVLQREWIDEPETGTYIVKNEHRITEWQVAWLFHNKRGPDSISHFIEGRKAMENKTTNDPTQRRQHTKRLQRTRKQR